MTDSPAPTRKKIPLKRGRKPGKSKRPAILPRPPRNYGFKPEFITTILEVAASGGWVPQMALACGVSKSCIYKWRDAHPEFGEAFETARVMVEALLNKIIMAGMTGELPKFNYAAAKDKLNQICPGEYKFFEGTGRNNIGTNITVNNLQVLPDDQLNNKIAALTGMVKQFEIASGKEPIEARPEPIEDGISSPA